MVNRDALAALARNAGAAILEVYQREGDIAVELKGDQSPLTEADRASHEIIVRGLPDLKPELPIVSEEDGSHADPSVIMRGDYWLVDPLDGTKEFLKRTGEFTVNIALIRDGVPVAGVVHAPVLDTTWLGTIEGAERWHGDTRERLRVTAPAKARAMRVVASRDHAGPAVQALLQRLRGSTTVSMGSSLKFCLIADGRADLYYRDGPTFPWDTAAAHAVLAAAGGDVYATTGEPLRYLTPRQRNPHFVAIGDTLFPWASYLPQGSTHEG